MTSASGHGDATVEGLELGADLLAALVAAAAWSAVAASRASGAGAAATFAVAFGCAALSLGVVVSVAKRARPFSPAVVVTGAGAALAAAPLAVMGMVLRTHTHHRALGAVTFVFVALALLLLAMGVARRLVALGRGASHGARLARVVLAAGCAASIGWVALSLLRTAPAAAGVSSVVKDGTLGVLATVIAVASPRIRPSASASRALTGAWALVVVGGLAAAASSPRARAVLAERAPIALGVGGLIGR